jgi:ribonuclease H2 subunit C
LSLSEKYTGAVLHITEKDMPSQSKGEEDDGDEDEMEVEVKIAEKVGEFDEVVVWGHGGPIGEDDVVVRGLKEWIDFAESMHGQEEEEEEQQQKIG